MFEMFTGPVVSPSALTLFPTLFIGFLIWSLVWKGFSLWHAAQKGDKQWFIALLILNTAGILDILYLFVFSKMGNKKETADTQPTEQK